MNVIKQPLGLDSRIVPGVTSSLEHKQNRDRESWIDDRVYQRIKYRERYFEPPAGPFA